MLPKCKKCCGCLFWITVRVLDAGYDVESCNLCAAIAQHSIKRFTNFEICGKVSTIDTRVQICANGVCSCIMSHYLFML